MMTEGMTTLLIVVGLIAITAYFVVTVMRAADRYLDSVKEPQP